jgi:hypothetical protein
VSVGSPSTCAEFESDVDRVVCAVTPEPFWGVGQWYRDFSQTPVAIRCASYRVDLTADYTERQSRQFSIFYDANLKKRVNPIVLYDEIALMGHVLSPASKFEDGDAVHAQWYPIVSAFCAQKGLTVETVDLTPIDSKTKWKWKAAPLLGGTYKFSSQIRLPDAFA